MSREKQIEIEVITYEQERLNYFTDLMNKANNKFNRLFKKYKDAPYLSEEFQRLSDAGRGAEFYKDVVKMLEKSYRKQSEPFSWGHENDSKWISVEERLPDNHRIVLVACESTTISAGVLIAIGSYGGGFWSLEELTAHCTSPSICNSSSLIGWSFPKCRRKAVGSNEYRYYSWTLFAMPDDWLFVWLLERGRGGVKSNRRFVVYAL